MNTMRITDPITFNATDLHTVSGWTTTSTDTFRYPTRNVTSYNLANTDTSKTTSAFFTERPINVSGVIVKSGRENLDVSISKLKQILQPINKTLVLPIAGEQRQFENVTVKNIAVSNVAGGYAKVDIEFVSSDRLNYAQSSTEVLNLVNLTSGNNSYPVTFEGTADQAPIITYTVDSVTDATNKQVSFINPSGNTITVERTWTALEVLIINCKLHSVTVDGAAVEFTGNFPVWSEGAGFINYTDTFTARQVDINVTYTKRYV